MTPVQFQRWIHNEKAGSMSSCNCNKNAYYPSQVSWILRIFCNDRHQLDHGSPNVGSVVRKGIISCWAERHNFCRIYCFMASVIMSFYVLHVKGAADALLLIKVTDITG